MRRWTSAGWMAALALALSGSVGAQQEETSCVACHSDAELFEEEHLEIARGFANDVHGRVGLSCHDCHGGNPDPALFEDMFEAMDEGFAENPYVGSPSVAEIPELCGRCHSDPSYMNRYNPDLRTDQLEEYWASHHGRRLREGSEKVATCTDCHGVHGILAADEPGSLTYPTRVAETCGRCHADGEQMAGITLVDGRDLPIDQVALWRQSVHAQALLEREDLSAPTCNDCHGNHGATPPGLESLSFVCGQCHGREADLFRASSKHRKLPDHREYMLDAGEDGCAACHEAPEPQAEILGWRSLGQCDACHSHHAVIRPSVAMLSPLPQTPCAFCHEATTEEGASPVDPGASGERYIAVREGLLARADSSWDGDQLFDWLVDEALVLPVHNRTSELGEREQRPEFRRLFEKFRIGKTSFRYTNPATGAEEFGKVTRCSDCHAREPALADEPRGATAAALMLSGMRQLTALTARAERSLLRARRGGVETRDGENDLDGAVDAQIELEVLVHSFATEEDSLFLAKQREGLEHARLALAASEEALEELGSRRTGLLISLAFIALLLVALGIKIRQLPS